MSEPTDLELAAEIEAVFGDRAPLARRYAELLVGDGILRGMIGPREAERIWPRHMFNSTALVGLVPANARVVDLGSGAGLPGIPLALARPDLSVELLEPMARRVRFLDDVLSDLAGQSQALLRPHPDLAPLNLTVRHARADAAPRGSADVVVARAVAPLPRLISLAAPLLAPKGRLLALKGESAAGEAEEVERAGGWQVTLHTIDAFRERAVVVEVEPAGNDGLSLNRMQARKGSR